MRILPVNEKPFIRAYANHLYNDAIINNEMTTGKNLATVNLVNNKDDKWTVFENKSKVKINNNIVNVYSEPYEINTHSIIQRDCKAKDEFIIKIDYQQNVNPWASICLFINNNTLNKDDLFTYVDYSYVFGKFCNNDFFTIKSFQSTNFSDKSYLQGYPYWMKISRNGNMLYSDISFDGKIWIPIDEYELSSINSSKCFVGVFFALCDNHYYNWLFANFIQLQDRRSLGMPIDYCVYPIKSFKLVMLNSFIDCYMEKKEAISTYGLGIWEFIIANINNNRYLDIPLDEFYVPNRKANIDGYHLTHSNLVYGYDDINMTVYLLGYNGGLPAVSTMDARDFQTAYEACPSHEYIYIWEYKADLASYPINLKQICRGLSDYLNSHNSDDDLGYLFKPQQNICGIDLYDEFTKDDETIQIIINDLRVSYIVLEHKKIMKERLKYLVIREIVKEDEIYNIQHEVDEIYHISSMILNRIIKNKYKRVASIKEKTKTDLQKIKRMEIKAYTKLLDLLKQKI